MRRFSRLPAASSMRKPCGSAASRLTVWRRAHRPSAIVTAGLFAPSTGPGERRVVAMTWESTATVMRCARSNQLVTGSARRADDRMSAHHELELDDVYISSCDTSRAGSDKPVHMALSY